MAFDPRAFLANAGIGRTIRHFSPKQIIFSQGERADAVLYIQDGTARLSVVSKQGKEATIALLGPGDFLGEGCIASDQPFHMTTAIATTHCSVLQIEKREMLRTLHEEHKFSDMFLAYVVGRHNRTQSDLVDQLFNSTEKRLARTLLLLARFGKEGRSDTLIPGVNQQTLAEMIGTTRSHVNVFLNRFRKLGFIEYNGGLKVHSSLLSVVLHEQSRIGSMEAMVIDVVITFPTEMGPFQAVYHFGRLDIRLVVHSATSVRTQRLTEVVFKSYRRCESPVTRHA